MERGTVRLINSLDWRLRLLNYTLLHAASVEGESDLRKLVDDSAMLLLEIMQIVGAIREHCILCKPDCPTCAGIEEAR